MREYCANLLNQDIFYADICGFGLTVINGLTKSQFKGTLSQGPLHFEVKNVLKFKFNTFSHTECQEKEIK